MALDLVNHEKKMTKAVATFWANRDKAREKQLASGKSDQGERAGVTAGKNMDGFLDLIIDLVKANGLAKAEIHQKRAAVTLPVLLPTHQTLGSARHPPRPAHRRHRTQESSGTFIRQQLQQPDRRSHRHRTRLLDGLPRRCLRPTTPPVRRLVDAG
jgi:hypothetical protein